MLTNNGVIVVKDLHQIISDWEPQALAAISNICHPMYPFNHNPNGNMRLIVDDTGA